MTEARKEIQVYGLTSQDTISVFTQAMIDMRNGGISAAEGLSMAAMVREMNSRVQTRLNAVNMQLKCRAMGVDFGELIRVAKELELEGHTEQPEA